MDIKIKKISLVIVSIAVVGLIGSSIYYINNYNKSMNKPVIKTAKKITKEDIEKYYSKYVKTKNYGIIYDSEYKEIGKVNKGIILTLDEVEISENTLYFPFTFNNKVYNISYKNLEPAKEPKENQKRYKHYVPFDESITTNDIYSIYKENKSIIKFHNGGIELPIYIKEKDKYGVVINDEIYYIKKEDIKSTNYKKNSNMVKASRISTLLYHFIYDRKTEKCNQIICNSTDQVQSHIDYLKENNFFTLTMDEFEMFIDKKLNVQKNSLLITLDDGLFAMNAKKMFTDNKMNISMFIVSSWFDPMTFVTDYVEVHSHTHNLHNAGACPTGQGGGIQCLSEELIKKDLKTSRTKTNMTRALAYPFYEYNNYSIKLLKKVGFTLGFGGLYEGGSYKAYPGYNKFKIPRVTILNSTTVNDLRGAVN